MGRFDFTDLLIMFGFHIIAVFLGFALGRDTPRQRREIFGPAIVSFIAAFIAHIIAFSLLGKHGQELPELAPRFIVAAVWGVVSGLTIELMMRPPWLVALLCGLFSFAGFVGFAYVAPLIKTL